MMINDVSYWIELIENTQSPESEIQKQAENQLLEYQHKKFLILYLSLSAFLTQDFNCFDSLNTFKFQLYVSILLLSSIGPKNFHHFLRSFFEKSSYNNITQQFINITVVNLSNHEQKFLNSFSFCLRNMNRITPKSFFPLLLEIIHHLYNYNPLVKSLILEIYETILNLNYFKSP
jgi:hypothetical protein